MCGAGEKPEDQLKVWKSMIDGGCSPQRQKSLSLLPTRSPPSSHAKINELDLQLYQTTAGRILGLELGELVRRHQKCLEWRVEGTDA